MTLDAPYSGVCYAPATEIAQIAARSRAPWALAIGRDLSGAP